MRNYNSGDMVVTFMLINYIYETCMYRQENKPTKRMTHTRSARLMFSFQTCKVTPVSFLEPKRRETM